MTNAVGTEKFAVVGTIDPDVLAAGQHDSDSVDMSLFESVTVIAMVGTLGSSATVACVVKSGAVDGTFGNTVDTASTLTQASTDQSDRQVVFNIRGEDLTAGDRYLRLEMTVAVASSDGGAILLGHNPRYSPASDSDLASVEQIRNSSDV